ncbi:winged helix-turn-helix transcriptional regulator [Marinifilum fragile]|uniref:winged helix-turn-helix transcriptional regulator n=1 Tax=Marinifilum fragile TaxID=570161 RepID=UPI002AA84F16|nr:winged helix-turn-helix transcriptional regulator [Marinifilum fragile]
MLRYGELKKMVQNITSKMLTQTLRELEEDNLLNRKVYPVVPPKVEYSLTETGKELIPFIEHIGAWGRAQMEKEKIKVEN